MSRAHAQFDRSFPDVPECGIFERTHHRPRPSQTDEGKLRKTPASYRRDAPPPLQMMKEDSEDSPLPSPCTFTSNPPFPRQSLTRPYSLSPDSAVASQIGPLSGSGDPFLFPIPRSDQPLLSSSALPQRRSHGAHGPRGNPYAHAYAERRTASYNSSMRGGEVVNGESSGSGGGLSGEAWGTARRHSDTSGGH